MVPAFTGVDPTSSVSLRITIRFFFAACVPQPVRDWLYVEDHARALNECATRGTPGETYNIGGHNEVGNIDEVNMICGLLEELAPGRPVNTHRFADLVTFVPDRPGHDVRYAIDASKIERELEWKPEQTFESGLRQTVQWYLDNEASCRDVQSGNDQREGLGVIR